MSVVENDYYKNHIKTNSFINSTINDTYREQSIISNDTYRNNLKSTLSGYKEIREQSRTI